jgi:uncharacterized protein
MQNNSFGRRGVPAKAANPYTGTRMAVEGQANYSSETGVDENLRAFMLTVYNLMTAGLAITGCVAFMTYWMTVTGDAASAALWDDGVPMQITETEYLNDLGALLWTTPLQYALMFGPLAIILFTSALWRRLSAGAALAGFIAISALIGVSFSGLALTYTNGSIAQMFFATSAAFGGLSLFGYSTGKDLSGWGSFLWMGLFGIIAAMICGFFWPSGALSFAINVIGVIVFSGFTAYDTQMIKQAYTDRLNPEDRTKLAISGALDLYLDFINLFRFLLALFGSRE